MAEYMRIADALAARIEAGEWPREGSERERRWLTREQIRSEYDTTPAAVDAVVRALRVRGLIVTRPDGGAYIRPPKPTRIVIPAAEDDAPWMANDTTGATELGAFSWVREELGAHADAVVYRRRRTLTRDGEVYGISDTYSVDRDAEVLPASPMEPAHRIRTWLPCDEETVALGMPAEVPVLALLNRVPGGVAVRIFPGDHMEYRP